MLLLCPSLSALRLASRGAMEAKANGTGKQSAVLLTVFFIVLPCSAACCCSSVLKGLPICSGRHAAAQAADEAAHFVEASMSMSPVQAARLACVCGGQTSPFR